MRSSVRSTTYLLGWSRSRRRCCSSPHLVARAGVVGGALAALIFLATSSMLLALPVWEQSLGGFPALNGAGQFLIKDIALPASRCWCWAKSG